MSVEISLRLFVSQFYINIVFIFKIINSNDDNRTIKESVTRPILNNKNKMFTPLPESYKFPCGVRYIDQLLYDTVVHP